MICTFYRPPSATSEWIDLLEEELSVDQTTGLEMIIMGDVNIDNNSKKLRSFKSKENIHKKDVGPYHVFGFQACSNTISGLTLCSCLI